MYVRHHHRESVHKEKAVEIQKSPQGDLVSIKQTNKQTQHQKAHATGHGGTRLLRVTRQNPVPYSTSEITQHSWCYRDKIIKLEVTVLNSCLTGTIIWQITKNWAHTSANPCWGSGQEAKRVVDTMISKSSLSAEFHTLQEWYLCTLSLYLLVTGAHVAI